MTTHEYEPAAMASAPALEPADARAGEPMFHNPVLSRTARRQGGGDRSWLMLVPLGLVAAIGAGVWAYDQMKPAPLMSPTVASEDSTPASPPPAALPAPPSVESAPIAAPTRYAESLPRAAPTHRVTPAPDAPAQASTAADAGAPSASSDSATAAASAVTTPAPPPA
ncbi:MAG: hypothetical protein ACHP7N_15180, partial [Caulobacterales bacterium]